MTKTWSVLLLSATCACVPATCLARPMANTSSYWTGLYAGGQVGLNDSSADHTDSSLAFAISPHIGFNLPLPVNSRYSPLILGADFFFDHNGSVDHGAPGHPHFGSDVYGVDFLAGIPLGVQRRIMPYAKIGFGDVNGTDDSNEDDVGFRVGLGAEYHLRRNWGLTAEWMHQDSNSITNDNFMVGMNYHFGRI